ncbi:hypothetical protein CHISP_0584 [Chitinispirillum alkaliphilum]|nr:hypothetical protein CHISP_0584 [Chitinispirillum alkaliphilum]
MIRSTGFRPTGVQSKQLGIEKTLSMLKPLHSWIRTGETDSSKVGGADHKCGVNARFSIKGGFTGSGVNRRMVIVGKIGRF